jgi:hypothetical protein
MKKYLTIGIAVLGLFLFAPQTHASWSYYRSFTATSSATAIPASQSNFPAVIDVTLTSLKSTGNGGNVQSSNGYDIVPFSDSACTSQLPFERENYVSSTGELEMWVKQSTMNTSTVDYLCYGNAAQTTDLSSSTAPWDGNYKGVYHLNAPTGTLSANDSTSNGMNGTIHGGMAASAGKIDGGTLCDTDSKYIDLGTSFFNSTHAQVTFSGWVNITSWGTVNAILGGNGNSESMYNYVSLNWEVHTSGTSGTAAKTTPSTGAWHYLVSTYDGSNATIYVDGVAGTPVTATGNTIATGLGLFISGSGGIYGTNGYADEFRVSDLGRSADWIKTEYNNQNSPSTFWSVGSEQSGGGGGGGTTNPVLQAIGAYIKMIGAYFKML